MNGRAERRELLEAKKKRLYELQLKEALMGYDTPIHYLTEMKKLEGEIQELESQIFWYDDSPVPSNDIQVVHDIIDEQLKRLGTDEVVIRVQIYVRVHKRTSSRTSDFPREIRPYTGSYFFTGP